VNLCCLEDAAADRSRRRKTLSEDFVIGRRWAVWRHPETVAAIFVAQRCTDAAELSVVDLSRPDDRPPLPDAGSLRSWRSRTRFAESPKWMVQCTARGRPGKQV